VALRRRVGNAPLCAVVASRAHAESIGGRGNPVGRVILGLVRRWAEADAGESMPRNAVAVRA
jgi:hypothetical protein